MPVTRQLYELQELDIDIEHTEQTLELETGQLGKREALDDAQNTLTDAQKRLEELKRAHRDTEHQLDDILNKISDAEKQLYGGTVRNPKELSNLQHEINNLKSISDPLETKALELIDQVETAQKEVAALAADLSRLEEEWQGQQKQITGDIELLKQTLTGLREKRHQLVAQIEPSAASLYESIRRQKRQAVARVEQGICRVCRISLSASTLQKARSGQPVQCGTCGRILFIS